MGKGQETKRAILGEALQLASTVGLSGLTIGSLASATGMSKSGLFAHFRSKEQLQLQVLEEARQRFVEMVVLPALKQPRGVPRLRTMLDAALGSWEEDQPGGCVFYAVAAELDDQPGPARDYLVETQAEYADTLRRVTQQAIDEGQLRADLDVDQFVFELRALTAAYHHFGRLLGDPKAKERARIAFDSLLARSR